MPLTNDFFEGRRWIQSGQVGTSGTLRPGINQSLQKRLRLHWTTLLAQDG